MPLAMTHETTAIPNLINNDFRLERTSTATVTGLGGALSQIELYTTGYWRLTVPLMFESNVIGIFPRLVDSAGVHS
jgi:hypothetical protein